MNTASTMTRTVTYWRLIDATNASLSDQDWDSFLIAAQRRGPIQVTIDGRFVTGTVHRFAWDLEISQYLEAETNASSFRKDFADTFALVLAADKDFVSNQAHKTLGTQEPLSPNDGDWIPVDNTFVWFLPYGNMFAMMTESRSSVGTKTISSWINRALRELSSENNIVYTTAAVIDDERKELLKKTRRLKSAVYAGHIGSNTYAPKNAGEFLGLGGREIGGLRVEIKVTPIRGKTTPSDEIELSRWYDEVFGLVEGVRPSTVKAKVTVAADSELGSAETEIDLLRHRITRKASIDVEAGELRAFSARSSLYGILTAYAQDRISLLRLNGNRDA